MVSNTVTRETFATVSEALSALTEDGQTLILSPGVYTESEWILSYAVTIEGADPATTVLQADERPNRAASRLATVNIPVELGVTQAVVLARLTLRHGCASGNGGALAVQEGSVRVSRCVVSNNVATGSGGALFCMSGSDASLLVEDSVIADNAASQQGGGAMRGRYLRCAFTGNAAADGGAAALSELSECVVSNNQATGNGGGLYQCGANRCRVERNAALFGGGAFRTTLANSLLASNEAGQSGGGLYLGAVTNGTVVANVAASSGGGVWGGSAVNSILFGNAAALGTNYSDAAVLMFCCSVPLAAGGGNVAADPFFSDFDNGDFSLRPFSPCLDAGTAAAVVGESDLAGYARVYGATVDLGAFELNQLRTVAAPTFDPADGATFETSLQVALACATDGAEIRYTLDGAEPATNSALYASALTLTETTTVKARAFKGGMAGSAVASATYTKLVPAATPTFTPANGATFETSLQVALACATDGAEIRYTLDGTAPTTNSSLYASALTLTETTTVKARAFKGGMAGSAVASATYIKEATNDNFTLLGAVYYGGSGDQQGAGVTVANGKVFAVGKSASNDGDGLAVCYSASLTNGASSLWGFVWPGVAGLDTFDSICATTNALYIGGQSYSETTDGSGGKESKGIVARFPMNGASTPVWKCQVGGLSYKGWEMVLGVAFDNGVSPTNLYSWGFSQKSGDSKNLILSKRELVTGTAVWTVNDDAVSGLFAERYGRSLCVLNGAVYGVGDAWNGSVNQTVIEKYNGVTGALVWERHSLSSQNRAYFGVARETNALYAVGVNGVMGASADFLVEKWSESGTLLWSKTIDWGSPSDVLRAAVVGGGRVFLTGYTKANSAGGTDLVVLTIDSESGSVVASAQYGGAADEYGYGMALSENDLYVVGSTGSFGGGGNDLLLLRYAIPTQGTAAMPEFEPESGVSFENVLPVSLTCATAGATIRYTLDGLEPTADSLLYTAPFDLSATTTVRARAYRCGMADSAVASATYTKLMPAATLTTPVPVPFEWLDTFSLAGSGDYEDAALADSDGDGHKAWEEYVAGSCPTNEASRFLVWLTLSNSLPHMFWTPDLGEARRYTVEGKASLRDAEWVSPTNAASRFFRVRVEMP